MRTLLGDQIYEILRCRVGRDNAIHAHEIADQLGLKPRMEREIRRRIADERALWAAKLGNASIFVVSLSGGGFFACADYDEYVLCRGWIAGLAESAQQKLTDLDGTAAIYGFGKPQEQRRAA